MRFPAPHSFGEDVAELHLHGGPAVIGNTHRLRCNKECLAEPGEFTRRAFDNDKPTSRRPKASPT